MPRAMLVLVIAIALAAGFVAGQAVQRPSMAAGPGGTAAGLTEFERGQLITGCYQVAATVMVGAGDALVALFDNLAKTCLDRVDKLP